MSGKQQNIRRFLYTDVFLLGFTLIGAQIILIREFLLFYNGNELVIGLLFTIWMLLTAIGSWAGRFFNVRSDYPKLIRGLLVLLTVYPIIAVFCIEYFRNDIFEYGRMASLYEIIVYSFLVLLPICVSGGFLFTVLNNSLGKGAGRLHNCYAVESFGSLVGGIVISLYFIYILEVDNFRSLTYLLLINFVYFGITDFRQGKETRSFIFLIAAIGFMFLIYKTNPGRIAKEKFFDGQELLMTRETPFGNLSMTRTNGQINYYENGVILFSDGNVVQREEDVHYALLQKPDAKNVLLIGGGITGTISEILKYPSIENITYIDISPEIVSLTAEYIDKTTKAISNTIIKTYALDPVFFISQTKKSFDVILINLPSPVNAQLNRYFTLEFYQKLKRVIGHNGLVSTRLSSSANYLNEHEVKLQASIFNSISRVFEHILIVPAGKNYFIASDQILTHDYVNRFLALKPDNTYVNSDYLNDDLIKFRSDKLLESYAGINTVNYDFKPIVYLSYIRHWMSFYGNSYWIIPLLCILVVIVFILFSKPFSSAMFASGFTGAGTEIVLLIVFQILVGYVYLFLGVVITIFMAGLMIGAFLSRNISKEKTNKLTILTQLLSGVCIVTISVSLIFLKDVHSGSIIQFIVSIFMLIISGLVGYQYGLSVTGSRAKPGNVVSVVYSADLAGSAVGSILVAILIIPVLGIYLTLYCLAGLHFLTVLFYLFKHKIKYL